MTLSFVRRLLFGSALLAISVAPSSQAQTCPEDGLLGVLLAEGEIQSVAELRRSTFAHGFLISLIAERGRPDHPVVQEALRVTAAGVSAAIDPDGSLAFDNLVACLRAERRHADDANVLARDLETLGGFDTVLYAAVSGLLRGEGESPEDVAKTLATGDRLERLDQLAPRLAAALGARDTLVQEVSRLARYVQEARKWQTCRTNSEEIREATRAIEQSGSALPTVEDPDLIDPDPESGPDPDASDPSGQEDTRRDSLEAVIQDLKRAREREGCDGTAEEADPPPPTFAPSPRTVVEGILNRWRALRDDPAASQLHLGGGATKRRSGQSTSLAAEPSLTIGSTQNVEQLSGNGESLLGSASLPAELFVALADYAVERMRDDLVLTYLRDVPDRLGKHGWIQELLPETYRLTEGRDSGDLYDLSLPTWRAALITDIHRLPINTFNSDALVTRVAGQNRDQAIALRRVRAGLSVAQEFRETGRALSLLDNLEEVFARDLSADDPLRDRFVVGGKLAGRLGRDLQVQDVDVRADSLPAYVLSARTLRRTSARHMRAYLRLLRHDVPTLDLSEPDQTLESLALAVSQTTDLLEGVERLSSVAADARAPVVAELVRLGIEIPLGLATSIEEGSDEKEGEEMSGDEIIEALRSLRETWTKATRILALLDEGESTAALSRSLALFSEVAEERLPNEYGVLPLVTLAAALADAEGSDGMVQAFRAAAVPPGSASARRAGRGARFALSMYPGVVVGGESVVGEPFLGGEGDSRVAGLTLPVGVDMHLFGPLSLFVSAIDLGAYLSYRLADPDEEGSARTIEDTPDVTFREVFSPGGALTIGPQSAPVALSLSLQFMPSLRNVSEAGEERPDASVFRFGVSLSYDLPLLNLSRVRELPRD